MNLDVNEVKLVIDRMRDKFDAHDFIRIFAMTHPQEYWQCLLECNDIRDAHSQIAEFLSRHASELGITKLPDVISANIYNKPTKCSSWKRNK